ncbi:GNAT family N-acetyltransferase [Ethanoligenens sp.]|uniref:GNAT family N-acetyltransferase n=1 Tax=Ethanoligenens sp. TaxID=2099655 RepID=UPI0039ED1C94
MDAVIRSMNDKDWPSVSKIYRQGIETGKATFQSDIPTYDDWDAAHIRECRFVAVVDGEVVGWVALSKISSRCVYGGVAEVSIYIAENYREEGVGRQLLKYLITESEKAGFWMLQSGIMEDNTASIRLHERCGFRMVGYREKIGKDVRGKWRNNVLMEKRSHLVGID